MQTSDARFRILVFRMSENVRSWNHASKTWTIGSFKQGPKLRTRFTPRLIFSRLLFVKTNAQETQVLTLYSHYINTILHWERVHAQTSFPAARFQFYFILYLKVVTVKEKISVKMTSPDDKTTFFICRIRMFLIY